MNSIYWYGVHAVFPDVTYFLYFLMWFTIYCISRCDVYIVLHTFIAFPVMAYILYILMWRIYYSSELHSNSWYCVHPVLPDGHTFCISWCDVQYIGSPDMTDLLFFRHTQYFPVWRTSVCSCVSYLLYFLMWRTLHRVSSYGVYIVLQT